MRDYLTEVNCVMNHLATMPDVLMTALGSETEFLVLSCARGNYVESDDWASSFEVNLESPQVRGTLIERRASILGVSAVFLFAEPSWACLDPISAETAKMIEDGLFEIHDPRGIVETLNQRLEISHATFADNGEIAKHADISSDFFSLVGLGEATFISDKSALIDWCNLSGLPLEHANARIREIYGVDVTDLEGGRLIDIFERIKNGEYYRSWRGER